MRAVLLWWLVAQGLGWAALPITRRVFAWLPQRGYAFSKAVGLLLTAYIWWLGVSAGLLANDLGGVLLAVLLMAAVSVWQMLRGKPISLATVRERWRQQRRLRRHIAWVEGLFLLSFVGWALVRAYAPSKIVYAYGEKFMEFAFLNGILRSPTFPPLDPWLAGHTISYYYFGYVMMALVTRLAGSSAAIGFDLYDALLFALTLSGAYGLVHSMVRANRGTARAAAGFGLLGAVFVGGMGNLEGIIQSLYSARLLPKAWLAWLAIPGLLNDPQNGSLYPGHDFYQWWWWRASRILNDVDLRGQPIGSQPISEFPLFSFLLGDNHPHKLALPFVLLAIGLALNLLLRHTSRARVGRPPVRQARLRVMRVLRRRQRLALRQPARITPGADSAASRAAKQAEKRAEKRAAWRRPNALGLWLFYALALGGLGFLNTWDMPIYVGLVVLADAAGRSWARGRITRADLWASLKLGAGLSLAAVGLYLLFYLHFSSQAGGILPYVFPPTRLAQLTVMFGPFLWVCSFFALGLALKAGATRGWRLSDGLRQTARAWAWLTALAYGPYLLVVGIVLLLLNSGVFGLNAAVSAQLQTWLGNLPLEQVFGRILAARLRDPWTYLALSLLLSVSVVALRAGLTDHGATVHPGRPIRRALSPAALFAALLMMVGLALVLVVEFYYLRDSFGVRMNTVFKFYFQAWVLLAVASAFGISWFWQQSGRRWAASRAVLLVGVAIFTVSGLVYSGLGITARVHAFAYPPNLDASATLAGQYPGHWSALPDDWAAIQWLQRHVDGAPVILEAPEKGSYSLRGRISAFTGLPTLLGWGGHETQWRGSGDLVAQRLGDIETIFTTPDASTALTLLHKWQVRYVIIGGLERRYISETCGADCDAQRALDKFEAALLPVFQHDTITIYAVPAETP